MRELEVFISGRQPPEGHIVDAIRVYCSAKPSTLEEALAAEQTRAITLDEKTFKHAASIATALTIASAATTAVAQLLSNPVWKVGVILFTFPAIAYVMAGGLLGFSAVRALPTFGIDMGFRIERDNDNSAVKRNALARALACQERINVIRAARNEAAFMSIRNGFFCIVIAICVVLLGVQFANKPRGIEQKISPASFQRG